MKHTPANKRGDLIRHAVKTAPKNTRIGVTYKARIRNVTMKNGKLTFEWSIFGSGK